MFRSFMERTTVFRTGKNGFQKRLLRDFSRRAIFHSLNFININHVESC